VEGAGYWEPPQSWNVTDDAAGLDGGPDSGSDIGSDDVVSPSVTGIGGADGEDSINMEISYANGNGGIMRAVGGDSASSSSGPSPTPGSTSGSAMKMKRKSGRQSGKRSFGAIPNGMNSLSTAPYPAGAGPSSVTCTSANGALPYSDANSTASRPRHSDVKGHASSTHHQHASKSKLYQLRVHLTDTNFRVLNLGLGVQVSAVSKYLDRELLHPTERETYRLYLKERGRGALDFFFSAFGILFC
jgi:hypothetical protein